MLRYGPRSFAVAGLSTWNSLPAPLRSCHLTFAFRRDLKTELFIRAWLSILPARLWLFLAVTAGEHNFSTFSTHHHHRNHLWWRSFSHYVTWCTANMLVNASIDYPWQLEESPVVRKVLKSDIVVVGVVLSSQDIDCCLCRLWLCTYHTNSLA